MATPAGMTALVLGLEGVCLRRGNRQILTGVTFDACRGELVAITGPSGSGKTTILRAISGLEPFQTRSVSVEDVVLEGGAGVSSAMLARLRRKVGMVFQF